MTAQISNDVARSTLAPFGGLVVAPTGGKNLRDLSPEVLERWLIESKVLVLRGFPLLPTDELANYARQFGDILTWDFGEVLDLDIREDTENYLFTRGDVPFHWDGAFAAATPRFFMFQCVSAPPLGGGGETVFCDTAAVVAGADEATLARWRSVTCGYRTDKVEHYGGRVQAPLLATHPATGETVIRYAEPLPPEQYLNPLFVDVEGVPAQEVPELLADLRDRLHADDVCYHHEWQDGDIVLVDNWALVHGRNPFRGDASRHLQRIQMI